MRATLHGIRFIALAIVLIVWGCSQDRVTTPDQAELIQHTQAGGRSTWDRPAGPLARPSFVTGDPAGTPAHVTDVVRVYQDEQPWFGLNRAHASLLSIGKQLGVDYFIHPLIDLQSGIPANTEVVVITSNSEGDVGQAERQNHPAAQAALAEFLRAGGKLIVDMGGNVYDAGFIAPGAIGFPTRSAPKDEDCKNAFLTASAQDHPFRTAWNSLTSADLSWSNNWGCAVASHNLEQGIAIQEDYVALATMNFNTVQRVILAEYCYEGAGRVILDTISKEFEASPPEGDGPSYFMQNLFAYALADESDCGGPAEPPVPAAIAGVYSGLPSREPGVVHLIDEHLFIEVLDIESFLPRRASPADVRIGAGFGSGVPARDFEILDLDGDGRRDIRLRFSAPELIRRGLIGLQTTEVHVWGRDASDGQRYLGAAEVEVSVGHVQNDQEQLSTKDPIAPFMFGHLAQSFQTQESRPIVGAGIFIVPGFGSSDEVRISLWDGLPEQGGTRLAEAVATGTQGQWIDLFWSPVPLTPNTTYYLVFDGNWTLGIAGDIDDPYPYGHAFANWGFEPYPNFDYAFRTWVAAPGGQGLTIDQINRAPAPTEPAATAQPVCFATTATCR